MLRSRHCPLCGEEENVVEIFVGRVPNSMSVRRVIVKGGRRRRLRLFKEDLEDGVVVDFEANADFIMRHMMKPGEFLPSKVWMLLTITWTFLLVSSMTTLPRAQR